MAEVGSRHSTYVSAVDMDRLSDIFYRQMPGPNADYFSLSDRGDSLTLLKPLDFEALPTFNISIVAYNMQPGVFGSELNATCVLQVVVLDEDDQFPVFNSDVYQAFVTDTSVLNSEVIVQPAIAAHDPDTFNSTIIYSFRGMTLERESFQTIFPETD
ncbi:hypothetical protein EGW08_006931, partial [Elysia chlorotica]